MKRFQPTYSENSVTYWPSYGVGKIGMISLFVICALFVTTAIWTLLDNPSKETRLETLVALPIVVFVLCVVFHYTYRTMHKKIVVSIQGIAWFRNNVAIEKHVGWNDIEAIYFRQELWYGRKSCRIFLKKISPQSQCKIDKGHLALPVSSVDEKKLLQLIPKCLWANNPWDC